MSETDRYNMGDEHPAFTRAKALPEPLRSHFPKNVEEASAWKPHIRHRALHMNIIVAARTRIECAWAAYIGPVPGMNHDNEYQAVLDHGSKLDEAVARAIFPSFKGVPYAR